MKRPNLRIIGIGEGTEIQTKGMNNLFNKIISEYFRRHWGEIKNFLEVNKKTIQYMKISGML